MSWPLIWVYSPIFLRSRILVIHEDKFLAVKGWFGPGDWQLPGGGKKFSETSADAVIRELAEETDIILRTKDIEVLYSQKVMTWRGIPVRYSCHVAKLENMPNVTIEPREIAEFAWMSLASPPKKQGADISTALQEFAKQ